jgi:hypothetical protein
MSGLALFEVKYHRFKSGTGPAAAPNHHLVSSGAEYTPLIPECQYLVAIFFFNAIQCIPSASTLTSKLLIKRGFGRRSLPLRPRLRGIRGVLSADQSRSRFSLEQTSFAIHLDHRDHGPKITLLGYFPVPLFERRSS